MLLYNRVCLLFYSNIHNFVSAPCCLITCAGHIVRAFLPHCRWQSLSLTTGQIVYLNIAKSMKDSVIDQIRLYQIVRGVRSVMVFVAGNGHVDMSSKPG